MLTATPTHTFNGERFTLTSTGKVLGVVAARKRGRWQYRDADSGKLIASGVTPAEFVAQFWAGTLAPDGIA